MKLNLPKEFIWGTATAAHQVEGNNTNSDFGYLKIQKILHLLNPQELLVINLIDMRKI